MRYTTFCWLHESGVFDVKSVKAGDIIEARSKLLDLVAPPKEDTQFIKDVINKSFEPFLSKDQYDVKVLASNAITEFLVKSTRDSELILDTVNLFLDSFRDLEPNESVSDNITRLIQLVEYNPIQKRIREQIKTIKPGQFKNAEETSKIVLAIEKVTQLMKRTVHQRDSELLSDFIENVFEYVPDDRRYVYDDSEQIQAKLFEFVQIYRNDPEFAKNCVKNLALVIKSNDLGAFYMVEKIIKGIIRLIGEDDLQFISYTFSLITPLFECEPWRSSRLIAGIISEINNQLVQQVMDLFSPFLQDPDRNKRRHFRDAATTLVASNIPVIKYALNKMVPLLKHENEEIQREYSFCISELIDTYLRGGPDPQLIHDIIMENFMPALKGSALDVKEKALRFITECVTKYSFNDKTSLMKNIIQGLFPALQDSQYQVKSLVLRVLLEIIQKNKDSKEIQLLIQDIMEALVPLRKDVDPVTRRSALLIIPELAKIDPRDNAGFKREILDELALILKSIEGESKISILEQIPNLLTSTQRDSQLSRHMISILSPYLQEPSLQKTALSSLTEIVEKDRELSLEVLDLLIPLQISQPVTVGMCKLAKICSKTDLQRSREVISILCQVLKGSDNGLKCDVVDNLPSLIQDIQDDQLSREFLNHICQFLQGSETSLRKKAKLNFMQTVKAIKNIDNQLIRHLIFEILAPIIQGPEDDFKGVFIFVVELMELADKSDTQLVKDAFDFLILLLEDRWACHKFSTSLPEFVEKIAPQFSRIAIQALTLCLKNLSGISRMNFFAGIKSLIKNESSDIAFIKDVINSITSHIVSEMELGMDRFEAFEHIFEIVSAVGDAGLAVEMMKNIIPQYRMRLLDNKTEFTTFISEIAQIKGTSADIISVLASFFDYYRDGYFPQEKALIANVLTEIVTMNEASQTDRDSVIKALIPLLNDNDHEVREVALNNIAALVKINETKLVKEVVENCTYPLQASESQLSSLASSKIIEILAHYDNDDQFVKDVIDTLSPIFNHSNPNVTKNALEILKSVLHKFLLNLDLFEKYLAHSSKALRDTLISFLLGCFEKYLHDFEALDQLSQRPLSDLTVEIVVEKLFEGGGKSEHLRGSLQEYLEKGQEEQLRLFLVSQINKIKTLKGPDIIQLAFVGIGHEKVSKDGSEREKLAESAKEVLNIQLKYLNEEGLIWINENCEKLLRLSAEAKVFYKKVYHKLLEDEEISPLEEELLIKFINQGLTTSLTRDGEVIFEGKRYKLKGENIELALEKIAKTVIGQQQDLLAMQYKQNEPIFKTSGLKGGMKQAAADIKEIRSVVDSRRALKIDAWILTRLKSLKFNSEIFLLEQRSAFGDHVVYHWNQQKLFRFYPGETPVLQEIFGSYIYGEAYQGEVFELTDSVGQKFLENSKRRPSGEGQSKSKQIYFQQELLKQGNEDRNSAVEEELAKKLDNNRAVLQSKLKSLNLKDTEINIIEDYYEGFVSTFSSVYTSSQAIDSGKLSIDDGEDFFSPVNLFIQLTSLAPFGIGNILSSGLEAARSYIKSTTIVNEAKFVKDFAIDAVELSDLVSKIALNLISNKEKRKEIIEAKDDEEVNNLINKVKNLITEKIEKLKNLAEKYTKMKNLFEKEVQTSPAFRLGQSDANKIINEWIGLKASQPDLRLKSEEKQKKFTKTIIDEAGEGLKVTSLPSSPQEMKSSAKGKTACCEIF